MFGWGNSEYSQLESVTDETQVSTPRRLPLKGVPGRVCRVAAAGSACALVNGRKGHREGYLPGPASVFHETLGSLSKMCPKCAMQAHESKVMHRGILVGEGVEEPQTVKFTCEREHLLLDGVGASLSKDTSAMHNIGVSVVHRGSN